MRIFPVHDEYISRAFDKQRFGRRCFPGVRHPPITRRSPASVDLSLYLAWKPRWPLIDRQCRAVLKWIRARSNEPASYFQPKWRRPWRGHVPSVHLFAALAQIAAFRASRRALKSPRRRAGPSIQTFRAHFIPTYLTEKSFATVD